MYSCPKCFDVFPKKYNLERHISKKNPCQDKRKKINYDFLGMGRQPFEEKFFVHSQASSSLLQQPKNEEVLPANLRKSPVNLRKNPENVRLSHKINEKSLQIHDFPPANTRLFSPLDDIENDPLTKAILNTNSMFALLEKSNDDIKADYMLCDLHSKDVDQSPFEDQSIICTLCGIKIKHKRNLKRHMEVCQKEKIEINSSQDDQMMTLIKEMDKIKNDFQNQINELKSKPNIIEKQPIEHHNHNQNVLNLLCVGNTDNYLDMLTEQWGFDKALDYIKDCALSHITGDCKLLEKIYFDAQQAIGPPPIRYLDKTRNKIEFIDENNKKILDIKGVLLMRRLVNNLQNSYLKGVNYLINRNLDEKRCPNKFLADYDIQSWNNHIYNLCDLKYQKRLLTQLDIPVLPLEAKS